MGLARQIRIEKEMSDFLRGASTQEAGALRQLANLVGKELDYIEKNVGVSPESATGPIVAIAGVNGTGAIAGINIRSGNENVTANVLTTVNYKLNGAIAPLVKDEHYLKADFYNLAGEWVMSVLPTDQTKDGFKITAPENGKVKYVAVEG